MELTSQKIKPLSLSWIFTILLIGFVIFKFMPDLYNMYKIQNIIGNYYTDDEKIYNQMKELLAFAECKDQLVSGLSIDSDQFNLDCSESQAVLHHVSGLGMTKNYRRLAPIEGSSED